MGAQNGNSIVAKTKKDVVPFAVGVGLRFNSVPARKLIMANGEKRDHDFTQRDETRRSFLGERFFDIIRM